MNWRTFLILLWLTAFGLVSLVVYERASRPLSLEHYLAIGCTVAAIGLVTAWVVFGHSPFAVRATVGVVVVVVSARLLSGLLHESGPPADRAFQLLLMLHASELFVAGLSMAMLRRYGVRLPTSSKLFYKNAEIRRRSQFSLAMLLICVGCAAIVTAAVRWAVSLDSGAWEAVWMGAVLGGFATSAVVIAWLRSFVILRLATMAVAAGILIVGLSLPDIRVGYLVDVVPPMLFFMSTSIVVFRVCGYRLEWAPKVAFNEREEMLGVR